MNRLYPFQDEGVAFLVARRRAYLADEMGLGKTVQAITAAWELGIAPKDTVVICPASVQENWRREFDTWGPGGEPRVFSYSTLIRRDYKSLPSDLCILDEAHYAKNPRAKRTRAALWVAHKSKWAWALSGTPMPNDPRELWTVCRTLFPEIPRRLGLTREFEWMDEFCIWERTQYGIRVHGMKEDAKRRLLPLLRSVMLRRRLKDVALELPELRFDLFRLPKDPGLAKKLRELFEDAPLESSNPEHLATLRRLLGEYKAPKIAAQLIEEMEDDQYDQIVVMYYHKATGDALAEAFDAASISWSGFRGETPPGERQEAIDSFQRGEARVFLSQQTAAGIGITLTAAHEIVLVEPAWSPEDNKQAIKRIHRIGQGQPCRARIFTVPDSLDESVMDTLRRKASMINELINEE